MHLQRLVEPGRQDGAAVLASLPVAHRDLAAGEVDVLDAEPAALEEAEPGAVHEPGHHLRRPAQAAQDRLHLVGGEDEGHAEGTLCSGDVLETG